jgi:hypothetical protein
MNIVQRGAALSAAILGFLAAFPALAAAPDAETARLISELGLRESATAMRDRPGWEKPRKVVLMGADAERVAWMQEAAPGVTLVAARERADAVREAADADVVIGECVPEVIAAGPRIRWVQRMYAGVERCIAQPVFSERGIVLTNMQKVAGPVMSEHVLAFMFALARGFASYVPAQARGEWAQDAVPEGRLWELKGRRMLVVGLGGIGTEVARRASALGMDVIAIRNSGTDGPPFVSQVGLPKDLAAFSGRSDVIVGQARRAVHQRRTRRHGRHRGPARGARGRPHRRRGPRRHRSGAAAAGAPALAHAERADHAARFRGGRG